MSAEPANIVRLHCEPEERWDEITVLLPPKRDRIADGEYQIRSVGLKKKDGFDRNTAEIVCEVYRGDWIQGDVIARVPLFVPIPGGKKMKKKDLSANSKLARLLYLVGVQGGGRRPVSLSALFRCDLSQTRWRSDPPCNPLGTFLLPPVV